MSDHKQKKNCMMDLSCHCVTQFTVEASLCLKEKVLSEFLSFVMYFSNISCSLNISHSHGPTSDVAITELKFGKLSYCLNYKGNVKSSQHNERLRFSVQKIIIKIFYIIDLDLNTVGSAFLQVFLTV